MSTFEDDTTASSFTADALRSSELVRFNPGLSRTCLQEDDVEYSPCPPRRHWPAHRADALPVRRNLLSSNSRATELQDSIDSPAHAFPAFRATNETPMRTSAPPDGSPFITPLPQPGPPKNTPLVKNLNSSPEPFDPNSAADINIRFAKEVVKLVVGPIPEEKFLGFLPPIPKDSPMPDARHAFKNVPRTVGHEKEMYPYVLEAINEGGRCPSVKFFDTSTRPERAGRGCNKPDILGFDIRLAKILVEKTLGKVYAALDISELFVEGKPDPKDDPFCDDHNHGQWTDKNRLTSFFAHLNCGARNPLEANRLLSILGQMARYVAEACARQHRVCYFSILIMGPFARLFRWDRSGVLVSRKFDYQKRPRVLCEFLWRFHIANPVQRGIDPTVVVALEAEEKLFKRVISEEVKFQLGIDANDKKKLGEAVQHHYRENNVTKIKAYNTINSQWEEYLVSVPVESPKWAAGDCTRGYWAVRLTGPDTGEPCYLKDTWRPAVPDMVKEGSIYEEMRDVHCICDLIGHGDVPNIELLKGKSLDRNREINCPVWFVPASNPDISECDEQSTLTQKYVDAEWFCDCLKKNKANDNEDYNCRIYKRIHYRLVLNEVGYRLCYFESAKELFEASRDVLKALQSAHASHKRLHRNVSLGNIVMVRNRSTGRREGRLIAWESSILEDEDRKARDYFRPCDWAFASVRSLKGNSGLLHSLEDDVESLFYVVLYGCIRWLPHNTTGDLGIWMSNFFDFSGTENGKMVGGLWKAKYMDESGQTFFEMFLFDNVHIYRWLRYGFKYLTTGELKADKLMAIFMRACQSPTLDDVKRCEHTVNDKHVEVQSQFNATRTVLKTAPGVMAQEATPQAHDTNGQNIDTIESLGRNSQNVDAKGGRKHVTFQNGRSPGFRRRSLDDLNSNSIPNHGPRPRTRSMAKVTRRSARLAGNGQKTE